MSFRFISVFRRLVLGFGAIAAVLAMSPAVAQKDAPRSAKSSVAAKKKTAARPVRKAEGRLQKTARTLRAQKTASLHRVGLPLRHDGESVGAFPSLRSAAALVLDQNTGEVLYEKNSEAVVPIASITKLMTAMVVLDAALNLEDEITITRDDIDTLRGSHSRLPVGAKLSREDALLAALMSSENRAAHALGRTYPGGLPAFVEAMNRKAEALGMKDSAFADPTGLSSGNVSTAKDLSRMVAAAHGYPVIRELTTTTSAYVDIGRYPVGYQNTNPLVKNRSWMIGLSKTGYIQEAGKCLVMQAWVAGRPTVMVLLDSNGKLTRIADANRVKKWLEKSPALAASATPSI
ncbi:MAG TPA: D-alanyl-D-alanine endopeptidase [Rhodocyclaceae bacterium]|nr:D-alanyl-D-alanine endopeptidase [Rhodocyclaceae bacterium]